MLRTVIARTGCEQEAEVEDITQEIFVAMHQKWQILLNERQLDWDALCKYVMGIAAKKRIDGYRSRMRARRVLAKFNNAHREHIVNFDETIFNSELWQWVKTLPPRQRTVFALRFWGDMDGNEIAKTMGIRPSTVRNQLVAIRNSYLGYFEPSSSYANEKGD